MISMCTYATHIYVPVYMYINVCVLCGEGTAVAGAVGSDGVDRMVAEEDRLVSAVVGGHAQPTP